MQTLSAHAHSTPVPTRVVTGRGTRLELPDNGRLNVVAWHDPVVETHGHLTTGDYVEWFWLPILGPTATWIVRRLAAYAISDVSTVIDLADLAASLGVTWQPGHDGPFSRALTRCVMFGACAPLADTEPMVLAVRRTMPQLPARHLARLPSSLREAHREWEEALRLARSPSQAGAHDSGG